MKRTASEAKVKNSRIRAIDQGTVYDVVGSMRQVVRRIENGKEGRITDAIVILRGSNGSIGSFHYGTGTRERSHYMVETVKNRLEPA